MGEREGCGEGKETRTGQWGLNQELVRFTLGLLLGGGIYYLYLINPHWGSHFLYLYLPLIAWIGLNSSPLVTVSISSLAALAALWPISSGMAGSSAETVLLQVASYFAMTVISINARNRILEEVAWYKAQMALLRGQLAEALNQNSRFQQEVNKMIFDLMAMYEFTTILGGTLNPAEVSSLLIDTVLRVVKYDACQLVLVNEASGAIEVQVERGFFPPDPSGLRRLYAEPLVQRVIRTGQPYITGKLEEEARPEEKKLRFRSLLCVPLSVHAKTIGALSMFKEAPEAFTQDDLRVLFIVANQAAWAIQNARLYEEVAHQAITDGLTGLFNHRYFRSALERSVEESDQTGQPVSMIMIDIDSFKAVNDRYGHQRGDMVLQEVARVLQESVRSMDLVARYGGEEFAVILPDTSLEEAIVVARRIHEAVAAHDFGDGLRLTVSVGVATYPSPHVRCKEDLINLADEYAYRAKESGKNRIWSS
ncbi:MAG: sensor domain-containing diguanylate cyclase [Bacillota bacterium]|nr:sensor domain-containing diguanylate cyclase [Bacillota bacterium]